MAPARPVGRLDAHLHDHRPSGRHAPRQRAFLRNLARGEAYLGRGADACGTSRSAPPSPRPSSRTVSARAPTTASRVPPAPTATSRSFIETTRPELLAACVALVAHPDDERYQPLFGTTVTTPVFGVEVPVHAHPLAEPDKGTGIAMICTFGDITDVTWWRELRPADPRRHRPGRPHPPPTPRTGIDDRSTASAALRQRSPARPSSRPASATVELLARDRRAASATPSRSRTR